MDKVSWLDNVGFVVKVLVVSTGIAIAIKTVGPRLAIPATSALSLAIVFIPSILLGLILLWQWRRLSHGDVPDPGSD